MSWKCHRPSIFNAPYLLYDLLKIRSRLADLLYNLVYDKSATNRCKWSVGLSPLAVRRLFCYAAVPNSSPA